MTALLLSRSEGMPEGVTEFFTPLCRVAAFADQPKWAKRIDCKLDSISVTLPEFFTVCVKITRFASGGAAPRWDPSS